MSQSISIVKHKKDLKFFIGDKVKITHPNSALLGEQGEVVRHTNYASRFVVRIKNQNWIVSGKEMEKV